MADKITKVDALGRLLIPKPIRVRLGLSPGSPIRIVEEERGLRLVPVEEEVSVAERDGLPVLKGKAVGSMEEAVEAQRKARIRDLGGE